MAPDRRRTPAPSHDVTLIGRLTQLAGLAGVGRADMVRDTSGQRLLRYRPGPEHRHYLICTECGLSRPVDSGPVEEWADALAQTSGFANVMHTVELSGVCPDCGRRLAADGRR
ncbi:transcriptional repressor [Streptomyces sparsogenes]|uniref:transcriptional repressor n=1 Tax=Streptomyces sparsogenes TaxID=67365 RepID=UPI0033263EFB